MAHPPATSGTRARSAIHRRQEKVLLGAVLFLVCFGLVMVYSATSADAVIAGHSPTGIIERQLAFTVVGFMALGLAVRIRPVALRRLAPLAMVVAGAMLVAVLILPPPVSPVINGATRWLVLGGVQVQPSEIAKLAVILWVAAIVARDPRMLTRRHGLVPLAVVVVTLAALIKFEPDLGTAAILVTIVLAMTFVGGIPVRKIGVMFGAVAALGLVTIATSQYQLDRVRGFLNPWADPVGEAFQNVQAQIAIGSGGMFGRGLGNSIQKMNYLPEAHTDMIGAIIGEELGLVGLFALMIGFVLVGFMGYRIAMRAGSLHARLLAVGVTTMIALQAAINLAQVLGLFPITGVPLPLVSAGGTNLVICLTGVGILINISRQGAHARARSIDRSGTTSRDRGGRDGRTREARDGGRRRAAS